jgi:hypothetical protein
MCRSVFAVLLIIVGKNIILTVQEYCILYLRIHQVKKEEEDTLFTILLKSVVNNSVKKTIRLN